MSHISVDHLLGMKAVVAQLELRYHAMSEERRGNPEAYSDDYLRGVRDAFWTADHILQETLVDLIIHDLPTYKKYRRLTHREPAEESR
jgi:hypothetical protein